MARTLLASLPAALVVAWSWLRLERGAHPGWQALAVVALGLVPALAPTRGRRAVAAAGAALLAVPVVALGQPLDRRFAFVPHAASRLGHGIGRFYAVTLPFTAEHATMHDAVLVGAFVVVLALSLALAARRTGLALAVLLLGAGWPASLLTGSELLRGGAILAAALWLLAALRAGGSWVRPLAAGAVVVAAAVGASTSSGIAHGAFVDWQRWGASAAQSPVSVAYVWSSDYSGLHWPRKTTDVLRVRGTSRSLYWRATTLDAFRDGRWLEEPTPVTGPTDDPSVPARAFGAPLVHQQVEVLALRDTHLPAGGTPLRYRAGASIAYSLGGVAHVASLRHGEDYEVWSYAPTPGPKQAAAGGSRYPARLDDGFLEVGPVALAPRFGAPGRQASVAALFRAHPGLSAYRPLYAQALRVAGRARTPYATALALESWFRTSGAFRYDEHPPLARGRPELVDFVVGTRAGYCQHFAGAMALMLRWLGVPARVAVGFTSGTYDAASESWTVTDHDAHAWVEAWMPGWGWLPFDPTPGRGQLDGAYTAASPSFDASAAAAALPFGSAARTDLARKAAANPAILGERPSSRGGGPLGPVPSPGGHPVLLGMALALLLGLMGFALGKPASRRARTLRARDPRALALACRRELVAYAADQGVALPGGATLAELVPRVREQLGADAGSFAAAATAAAYAPPEHAAEAAAALRAELRLLLCAVRVRLPFRRRLRGALSLRSL